MELFISNELAPVNYVGVDFVRGGFSRVDFVGIPFITFQIQCAISAHYYTQIDVKQFVDSIHFGPPL